MLGRPPAVHRGPAQGPAQAAHRLARDREAVDFAELLGQVRIIEAA
jgi:hypothetical protein